MQYTLHTIKSITTVLLLLATQLVFTQANKETLPNKFNQQLSKQNTAVFEENKGQMKDQNWQPRPDVLYYGKSEGMNYYIRNSGISYQLSRVENWKDAEDDLREPKEKKKVPDQIGTYRVDAEWLNCNKNFAVEKRKAVEGYNNYYNVPEGVAPALFVKQYESITLKNLWSGIDVHYYSTNGFLETDYIVAPGADYKQIQIEVKGAELSADAEGNLIMKTPFGEIREGKLKVYQNNELLEAEWVINKGLISFEIYNYNPALALRIDPLTRVWGTYCGGTQYESGEPSCTVDKSGNVYLSGMTASLNGISSGGHQNAYGGAVQEGDAFLVKFNSSGARQWATYYGGNGDEHGNSCATDKNGNVFLAGWTSSSIAIASSGHQNTYGGGNFDAFLAKFNTNGVLQWGTYYGDNGFDKGYGCATDNNNNVYLSGNTTSTNGISLNGHQNIYGTGGSGDGFLVKFDSSGTRQWGTYYGGSGSEFVNVCATDNSGNVCISGYTTSTSAIAHSGHQSTYGGGGYDAFIAKFDASGVRKWGTYYGGTENDLGLSCASDDNGNFYLSGRTKSITNIAFNGHQNAFAGGGVTNAYGDAFLVKFDSIGTRLWGTYYGGSNEEYHASCATDAGGNVYLAGITISVNGIALNGYKNTYNGVNQDGFLARFSPNGVRQWGTYYGGGSSDQAYACAIDNSNNVYLAGKASSTTEIATYGYQNTYGGGSSDAYIVKFKQPKINGLVWQDPNFNCVKDSTESGIIDNVILTVQPGNYIAQSKEGVWQIDELLVGTYTVTIDTSNKNWKLTCPVSQTFTVTNPIDFTDAPSFGIMPKYQCPKPEVSIVMPRMRRGFANQPIDVQVCNLNIATDTLSNAYVEVELDSNLIIQSGSMVYSALGNNRYRVDVGSLYQGQCVSFTFLATVGLTAVANQTLCISASLFPQPDCVFDSVSNPYPSGTSVSPCVLPYDNSFLKVLATCVNDSVRLVVYNSTTTPASDMVCYAPVRIFLDGLLYLEDSVQLNAGDSSVYVFAGSNKTWNIETYQHPLSFINNPITSAFIELCGTGSWTPGLANALPLPDAISTIDIYCGQVSAPLDPNDKTGFPSGVGSLHSIQRNQQIEYLIRFQNVGNDTAVNVVILDTLSTDLDIFSVRSGVSSHPYKFHMYGPRVLEWVFENIMLPDSNTNELASNGFVKFTVKQNKDLSYGTRIENTAAIYFDFESPVITNTYFHTVSPPQQITTVGIPVLSENPLKVIVAPNPMDNTATVTIENLNGNSNAEWQLYDLSGREAQTAVKFNGNKFLLNRNELKAGMYLYRITQEGQTVALGKLMVK
jgi:uncharacterized repeat protein (TIGR01451 family)